MNRRSEPPIRTDLQKRLAQLYIANHFVREIIDYIALKKLDISEINIGDLSSLFKNGEEKLNYVHALRDLDYVGSLGKYTKGSGKHQTRFRYVGQSLLEDAVKIVGCQTVWLELHIGPSRWARLELPGDYGREDIALICDHLKQLLP